MIIYQNHKRGGEKKKKTRKLSQVQKLIITAMTVLASEDKPFVSFNKIMHRSHLFLVIALL